MTHGLTVSPLPSLGEIKIRSLNYKVAATMKTHRGTHIHQQILHVCFYPSFGVVGLHIMMSHCLCYWTKTQRRSDFRFCMEKSLSGVTCSHLSVVRSCHCRRWYSHFTELKLMPSDTKVQQWKKFSVFVGILDLASLPDIKKISLPLVFLTVCTV